MVKQRRKNGVCPERTESDESASHSLPSNKRSSITKNGNSFVHQDFHAAHSTEGRHARCSVTHLIIDILIVTSYVTAFPSSTIETPTSVVLREGETETLRFHVEWLLDPSPNWQPAYTFQFRSKSFPFFIFDSFYTSGLKDPDQLQRFEIETDTQTDHSLVVDLIVQNVSIEDAGVYQMQLFVSNQDEYKHIYAVKFVEVYSPPSKASCYIVGSDYELYWYEAHCSAEMGSGDATISCFQNNRELNSDSNVSISERGNVAGGVFLIKCRSSISCCSHDVQENIARGLCQDFTWTPTSGDDCLQNFHGTSNATDDENSTASILENVAQPVQMPSCGNGVYHVSEWYYVLQTLLFFAV